MIVAVLVAISTAIVTAETLPDDKALVKQIRLKMAERLASLPNCICKQVIRQFYQRQPISDVEHEVAYVDGRELYYSRDTRKFEAKSLDELKGPGLFGTGQFALQSERVFVAADVAFDLVRDARHRSRRVLQYRFSVTRSASQIAIVDGRENVYVPYEGFFWADAETLDIERLQVKISEIPVRLQIKEILNTVEYGRVQVGGGIFLLPRRVEIKASTSSSGQFKTTIRLGDCRSYSVESKLTSGE